MSARLVLDRDGFVNSDKVMSHIDKKTARYIVRFASYVMRVAKRSMRKTTSPKPSKPGTPPRERYGQLEQFMIYRVARNGDVYKTIVGPRRLGQSIDPGILEHGGTQMVTRTNRKTGESYSFQITHPPRPFMTPAIQKALEVNSQFWDNSVRRKSK